MATSEHIPQWLFYVDTYNWVLPYDSHSNAKLENAFQPGINTISFLYCWPGRV